MSVRNPIPPALSREAKPPTFALDGAPSSADEAQLWNNFFTYGPLSCFYFDDTLRITKFNLRLAQLLKAPPEFLLGLSLTSLRDKRIEVAFREALAGRAATYEGQYETTYSDLRLSVRMFTYPLYDAVGGISGGIALVEDMTEHYRVLTSLRDSEARYRLLVEGSHEVFFYIYDNRSHRFYYFSPSVESVLGYPPNQFIGAPYSNLFKLDPLVNNTPPTALLDSASASLLPPYVTVVTAANGSRRYLELVEVPQEQDGVVVTIQGLARDVTEHRDRERLQVVLYEISNAVHYTHNLAALCGAIHQSLRRLLSAENLYLALAVPDAPEHTYTFVYDVNTHRAPLDSLPVHIPDSLTAYVVNSRQTIYLEEAEIHGLHKEGIIQLYGPVATMWLGVPLWLNGEIIGVVTIQSYRQDTPRYSERELYMLTFVSHQIAVAVERKRTHEELLASQERLFQLAHYDSLTQLPNRLYFYQRLEEALTTAQEQRTPMALFFLDMDNFKQINDSHGHDVGDEFLAIFAAEMSRLVGEKGQWSRLAGDEFTLILPDADRAAAQAVVDALFARLQNPFMCQDIALTVRVSIGIALFPDDATTVKELLHHADMAMYRAKAVDQNKSVFHADP